MTTSTATIRQARAAVDEWKSLLSTELILERMPQATNPLWRIRVNHVSFILKQLPEYSPGVPPMVEYRVLCHLQGSGVGVALPIITDAGTISSVVEGRQWILLPDLEHQSGNHELGPQAEKTAFNIGSAIGHLNKALAQYPFPVESFIDDPTKTLTETLIALPAEIQNQVRPVLGHLQSTCSDLPTQLTHGDCNDGNILLDAGEVVAIIDIDHLPTAPRVRDLAYYLTSRVRSHLANPEATDAMAMIDQVSSYVSGHQRAYPVTETEIQAVIPLMLLAELNGAHWSLHGWEPNLTNYRRNVDSITWMTVHFSELTQAAKLV